MGERPLIRNRLKPPRRAWHAAGRADRHHDRGPVLQLADIDADRGVTDIVTKGMADQGAYLCGGQAGAEQLPVCAVKPRHMKIKAPHPAIPDRKSTRLNSSHVEISY